RTARQTCGKLDKMGVGKVRLHYSNYIPVTANDDRQPDLRVSHQSQRGYLTLETAAYNFLPIQLVPPKWGKSTDRNQDLHLN
ncbi:hypothetical protein DPX16_10404, partial [Anabarilius grahami]